MFWSREPIINTVHPSEDWVVNHRETIEADVKRSSSVLDEYLRKFDPLIEFLQIDIAEFLLDVECKFGGKLREDEEEGEPKELDIDAIKDLSLKVRKLYITREILNTKLTSFNFFGNLYSLAKTAPCNPCRPGKILPGNNKPWALHPFLRKGARLDAGQAQRNCQEAHGHGRASHYRLHELCD